MSDYLGAIGSLTYTMMLKPAVDGDRSDVIVL